MRKMGLSLFVLLFVATSAIAVWQWRNYIVPLKIGIDGHYPPFTKTEADGRVTGLKLIWPSICASACVRVAN